MVLIIRQIQEVVRRDVRWIARTYVLHPSTQNNRGRHRARAYLLDQGGNQLSITMCTEHATQPKASADLDRHVHPDNTSLFLHPYLVSLHLAQVPELLYQVLMHRLCFRRTSCRRHDRCTDALYGYAHRCYLRRFALLPDSQGCGRIESVGPLACLLV